MVGIALPVRLRQVNLLGAGLLLGAALIVILPEGVHLWLAAEQAKGLASAAGAGDASTAQQLHRSPADEKHEHEREHGHGHVGHGENLWQIGVSLAAGFAFMVLVDSMGAGGHAHAHAHHPLPKPNG
jgi:zinc transporter 9